MGAGILNAGANGGPAVELQSAGIGVVVGTGRGVLKAAAAVPTPGEEPEAVLTHTLVNHCVPTASVAPRCKKTWHSPPVRAPLKRARAPRRIVAANGCQSLTANPRGRRVAHAPESVAPVADAARARARR